MADRKAVASWVALALMTVVTCFAAVTGVGYLLRINAISGVHWVPQEHIYDARLGWTKLIPLALANILATALFLEFVAPRLF